MSHYQDKKQVILVAMSGSVDSTVAAYLLRKQGHQCIGVGFVFHDGNESQKLNIECSLYDLNKVKTICDTLNMQFYAVNASKEFENEVIARAIAARLDGRSFSPAVYVHTLIIQLLAQKATLLKSKAIATGHYGSIFRNNRGQHWVMSANDLEHDQSYLFSLVTEEHLAILEFPLASVKKQEVLKIANTLNIQFTNNKKTMDHFCGPGPDFNHYLQQKTAPSLRSPGSIMRLKDNAHLAEHENVHQFALGDTKISLGKEDNYLDPNLMVLKITPRNGMVYLGFPEEMAIKYIVGKDFDPTARLNLSRPLAVFVKFNVNGDFYPAQLFPKNNCQVVLELETPLLRLFAGQIVGIYLKRERKYRLIAGVPITKVVELLQETEISEFETLKGPQESAESNVQAFEI